LNKGDISQIVFFQVFKFGVVFCKSRWSQNS
jgi:hypothetical protein